MGCVHSKQSRSHELQTLSHHTPEQQQPERLDQTLAASQPQHEQPSMPATANTQHESSDPDKPANFFVLVCEHNGALFADFTRQFMRHSALVLRRDAAISEIFHVKGTPGVGLTFNHERVPTADFHGAPEILAMVPVVHVPESRYAELHSALRAIRPEISRWWNVQDWVREGLDVMEKRGFITAHEKYLAVRKQLEAITLPS